MPDAIFDEPRLAEIYDQLEPERPDLEPYLAMVHEFGYRSVLDLGCGTGTFACLLASHGIEVIGVDPAAASLAVAGRKPFASKVRWLLGDATALPPMQVDFATMTGNVAQVFLTDEDWISTLGAVRAALRFRGRLAFEVRDPDKEAWREWDGARSRRRLVLPEVGAVETWVDLTAVELPLVTFRQTFCFETDGAEVTSDSTLCFRTGTQIKASLRAAGFAAPEVLDAPDRPGLELVFITQRGDG